MNTNEIDAVLEKVRGNRMGQPGEALAEGLRVLEEARAVAYQEGILRSLVVVAESAVILSEYEKGREAAQEGLALARSVGDIRICASLLNSLGSAQLRLGATSEALASFSESLELARSLGERLIESSSLNNLGRYYRMRGESARALELHLEGLAIAREEGDDYYIASALLAIGNTYERTGEYQKSLPVYSEALEIAMHHNDPRLQAYASGNIAIIYERTGNNAESLRYNLMSLELKRERNDLWGMGVSYNNIAILYRDLGEHASALEAHLRSLELTERIGDREGISVALNGIGTMYELMGEHSRVLEHYTRSLKIAREIGYRQGEAFSLNHIGRFYESLGDKSRALLHFFTSLRMLEKSDDRYGIRWVLMSIGDTFRSLQNNAQAAEHYQRALEITRETADLLGEAMVLVGIAGLQIDAENYAEAIALLEQSLAITRENGYRENEREALELLATTCRAIGDVAKGSRYQRDYHVCTQSIFNDEATRRVGELLHHFERNDLRRQGEELGLTSADIDHITDVMQRAEPIHPPRAHNRTSQSSISQNSTRQSSITMDGSSSSGRPTTEGIALLTSIEVVTFGTFNVRINGRELQRSDWQRKKARHLFKFLLIHHRRPITIDELIDKLWGQGADRRSEMLVMNAASHIRRALEPDRDARQPSTILASNDRTYTLDLGDDAWIDFLRFKELVVDARRATSARERSRLYTEAVALYRGDFLQEESFEEWSTSERELLKDAFLEATEHLAGEHLRSGQIEQAIESARLTLKHDSTSERGHEILLLGLRELGRTGEMRRAWDRCIETFHSEFGTEPPARIREIALSVR